MTTILALDSSTDACSVALIHDNHVTSLFEIAAKSHTQRLLPMVDEVLREAGCEKRQLDAIAFGRGPGSFTGLRICLGVVQGLAFGLNLPVVPVSTLAAMAEGFRRVNSLPDKSPILAALDARMNEVYWGLFASNEGAPAAITPEFVMSPADVAGQPAVQQHLASIIGVGAGWQYPDLQALPVAQIQQEFYPQAQDIVRLAVKLMAEGKSVSAMQAQPVYLRDQVSWQKRQRIRSE